MSEQESILTATQFFAVHEWFFEQKLDSPINNVAHVWQTPVL